MPQLSQQFPSLDGLNLPPELKTAIRQLGERVYAGRDTLAALFVDAEVPQGAIDAVNFTYQLAFPPNPPASLQLFLNGALLLVDVDYQLVGRNVTYTLPPPLLAWHRAYYRKAA